MRSLLMFACAAAVAAVGTVYAHDHHDESKRIDSHFDECFCWNNATNNFCGGDDFQNSDACRKLLIETFGWLPVYLVAAIATLVFPCCFYASRCLCNCCGGRHATRGCCCADSSSRQDFPGYRNRSILFTKIAFTVFFLGTVSLSVHVFVGNAHLSPDILNVVRDVNHTFGIYHGTLTAASDAVNAFANAPYSGLINAGLKSRINDVATKASTDLKDSFDIIKDVKEAEEQIRAPVTYHVPAVALLFLLLTFILMLCNARKTIGVLMVLTCVSLFTVETLAAVNGTIAVVTNVVCPNFQTAENVLIGAVRAAGACDNQQFVSDFSTIKDSAMLLVTHPQSDFCRDVNSACSAAPNGCTLTTCEDGEEYNTKVQPALTLFQVSVVLAQLSIDLAGVTSTAAQNVVAMRKPFETAATAEMSFPFVTTCGPLVNIIRTQWQRDLCNDGVNHTSAAVTAFTAGMIATMFFAIIFQIRGMKRFRPRHSYVEYETLMANEQARFAATPVVTPAPYYGEPVPGVLVIEGKDLSGYGSVHDRC